MTGPGSTDGGDAATAARRSFARHWAEQVAGTSYVPWGPVELSDYLLGLLDRLLDLLSASEYDASAVHQVGVDLVRAHFTGSETLQQTVVVLGEGLPALFDRPRPVDLDRRLVQALGALTAGYATALRDRALDEQDGIHRAMLTATREAEKRLAVSEARFRTMFREAALGIAIGDLAGNITDANPSLLQMFGYTAAEFTRRNVSEMVHPEDAPSI